jgi:hypothetical protein
VTEKTRRAKRHAATPHIIPSLAEGVDDEPEHAPDFLERGPALLTDAGHDAGRRFDERLNFSSSSERLISRHDQRESASVRCAGKRKMAPGWCNRANRVKPPSDASLAQLQASRSAMEMRRAECGPEADALRHFFGMAGLCLANVAGTGSSNGSYLGRYPWR